LENGVIQPLADIGEVTAKILKFNDVDRIIERRLLIEVERYPSRK